MRKTQLKRTTAGVVVFTVGIAVLMSILRALVINADEPGARQGASLFEGKGCSQCHYAASSETKIGPGLKGIFKRDTLPVSGKPVTEETIRDQLITPYDQMPSFADRLTEAETGVLIEYLKRL